MENKIESTEMHPIEQFLMNGCAFIPANVAGVGDCLSILLQNGDQLSIRRTPRWFLEEVVRAFGNDLVKMRKIYGKVTGRNTTFLCRLQITLHLFLLKGAIQLVDRQHMDGL